MRMNRLILFLAFGFGCFGCASNPDENLFSQQSKREELNKATFRKTYARYRISSASHPSFDARKQVALGRGSIVFDGRMTLELRLGARRTASQRHRTGSRYRLLSAEGRELVEAESTFAMADLPENPPKADVYFDHEHSEVLLFEEQSWTVQRYVLFRPRRISSRSGTIRNSSWEVLYPRMPVRPSAYGISSPEPRILGLAGHRIYFEQDGIFYAIPIDEIPQMSDLSYTIG
jgi:hypothetical protein